MKSSICCFLFLFLFMVCPPTNGQTVKTKIRGQITDSLTAEPLPFVNVAFINTTIGTTTDFNGNYYLETTQATDSILISYIGYKQQLLSIKKGAFQTIDVQLATSEIALEEIVVEAGENPAHILLRKIIAKKEKNNRKNLETYQYEVYNKIQFDINNIESRYRNKRSLKKFEFIFDYLDTSAITGKTYLPFFISEAISDYYYRSSPRKEKEIIKASQISGVENESIRQFTGEMYQYVNIYDDFIDIFDKSFISPIARFGLLYYEYYLIDSTNIDNQWCYQISFKPRRKQELTFTGDFWVHDTTFAVKKIKARIAEDANINYVNDLVVTHEYQLTPDTVWFLKKDELFIDFNLGDSIPGFFGKKTTSYRNVKTNQKYPDNFFNENALQITILNDSAEIRSKEYWNEARHEKLTDKEQEIYEMVDSIKNVPIFNTMSDIIIMLANGYYVTGNYEIGPYFTFVSYNPIEGYRLKIGGRTSNDFSTTIMPDVYVAYGLRDKKIKYGGGFIYMLSKLPRTSFGARYSNDMELLGESQNAFRTDNILSSILARELNDKLLPVEQYTAFFEKEWYQGFSNTLSLTHRTIFPSENIRFKDTHTQIEKQQITSFDIKLNTRLAYNEKYLLGEFERISLGTEYPIINLNLTYSPKNILSTDYQRLKLDINFQHNFNIKPLGEFQYIFEAGKIWSNVPYPLLHIHEGNQTYAFDPYAFNMMNYYEFAADEYISLYAEHHFQGLFFNKVPLFRRLKLREVIYGKSVIGSINAQNKQIIEFPGVLSAVKTPYIEAGIGVENILKIIRIDAIWRLTHLENPDIQTFGLRTVLQFVF